MSPVCPATTEKKLIKSSVSFSYYQLFLPLRLQTALTQWWRNTYRRYRDYSGLLVYLFTVVNESCEFFVSTSLLKPTLHPRTSAPNCLVIHPKVVQTFYPEPLMSICWWRYRKSQGVTKVSRIPPQQTSEFVVKMSEPKLMHPPCRH